jgi:predicted ribosomally synthesized peptide with nif11-like leader
MAADMASLPSKGTDMSISKIRRFASDLQTNAALCAEVDEQAQATHESLDGVIALATSKGYDFTAEELGASVRFARQVLTDDELDRVIGAAPASIDPSIASLLEPWVLP